VADYGIIPENINKTHAATARIEIQSTSLYFHESGDTSSLGVGESLWESVDMRRTPDSLLMMSSMSLFSNLFQKIVTI